MIADDAAGRGEQVPTAATDEVPGGQEPGSVTVLSEAGCTRLVMAGRVDVSMNAELYQAVDAAGQRGLSVEVMTQDVTSIDTAAIGLLAHLVNLLDRPLRFIAPPPAVRSLLDLTGITDTVEIIDQQLDLRRDTEPRWTSN